MNKPIIDPSTLTEEQREAIRIKYSELEIFSLTCNDMFADDAAILRWLFGKDFF